MEKSEVAMQIEKDHEFLKRDLGELKMKVMENVSPKAFPNWRLEFILRLRDFKKHLLEHFELEERGGFMREVLSQAPEAIDTLRALEQEHRQIAGSLDKIIANFEGLQERDVARLESIQESLRKLLITLRQHEAIETSLIQMTYS